jgi:hypothetical protein
MRQDVHSSSTHHLTGHGRASIKVVLHPRVRVSQKACAGPSVDLVLRAIRCSCWCQRNCDCAARSLHSLSCQVRVPPGPMPHQSFLAFSSVRQLMWYQQLLPSGWVDPISSHLSGPKRVASVTWITQDFKLGSYLTSAGCPSDPVSVDSNRMTRNT